MLRWGSGCFLFDKVRHTASKAMAIELAAIIKVAELVAKVAIDQNEKKSKALLVSDIARLIADNNAILIREMSSIVGKAFSQAKLDACNNTLSTLAIFYREFANNPEDLSKLSIIDQQAQFVLDILNDEDIALAGVRTYLATASIRMNALVAKAEFQQGDLANAKEVAVDSVAYVARMWPLLVESTIKRVTQLELYPSSCKKNIGRDFDGNQTFDLHCCALIQIKVDGDYAYVEEVDTGVELPKFDKMHKGQFMCRRIVLDGYNVPDIRKRILEKAGSAQSGLEQKLIGDLPLREMEACALQWKAFSQANNLVEEGASLRPLTDFLGDSSLDRFKQLSNESWDSLM
jgi:hypothetical protein